MAGGPLPPLLPFFKGKCPPLASNSIGFEAPTDWYRRRVHTSEPLVAALSSIRKWALQPRVEQGIATARFGLVHCARCCGSKSWQRRGYGTLVV